MNTTSELTSSQAKVFNEIVQEVKALLSHLPQGTTFEIENTKKNNNEEKPALVIREPGRSTAPIIYLDPVKESIESGKVTVQEAAEKIATIYKSSVPQNDLDIRELMKPENLFSEAINRDMNKDFLETVPHENVEDISIIARCRVSEEASFVVRNAAVGEFGMTPSELLETAKKNTIQEGMTVRPMAEVLFGLTGEEMIPFDGIPPLYVISNDRNCFGATMPFISEEARKEIYEKLGEDYYLIPSSVHENLAVPASFGNPEDLKAIIGDMNSTQVQAEEVLGTMPYVVDKSLKLKLACEQPKLTEVLAQSVKQGRGVHM